MIDGNRRLIEEIGLLCAAREKLRDTHEAAFLAITRYENRMVKIEKHLLLDNFTGLRIA